VAVGALTASPAMAHHAHHLELPNGNCADRGGAGFGTGQDHDDPGSFHLRVHTGTPGQFAFTQSSNPVAVVGGSTC
jgi:hypothetical protein